MSIFHLIPLLVIIFIFIMGMRRYQRRAAGLKPKGGSKAAGTRAPGGFINLVDKSPTTRITCFPTHNPLTGKPVKLDTNSDVATLQKAGLPVANSLDDLAREMGVTTGELYWLMSEGSNHYTPIELRGRRRSRLLFAPKPRMKACQRWILRNILNKVPSHPATEGFRKGHGIVTHARNHSGKCAVGSLDIHRFFDTVRSKRVYGVYRNMGYSEETALALALLTTRKGRLPQGAPTSPALANLVCRHLDARLTGLSKKFGISYSRYADDMAFSGDAEFAKSWKRFKKITATILRDEGFRLNPEKVRLMRAGSRQYVTGVVVNKMVSLPRERIRRMRAILHNSAKTGIEAQNRDNKPGWRDYLRGQISYISMVRPDRGAKLLEAFEKVK